MVFIWTRLACQYCSIKFTEVSFINLISLSILKKTKKKTHKSSCLLLGTLSLNSCLDCWCDFTFIATQKFYLWEDRKQNSPRLVGEFFVFLEWCWTWSWDLVLLAGLATEDHFIGRGSHTASCVTLVLVQVHPEQSACWESPHLWQQSTHSPGCGSTTGCAGPVPTGIPVEWGREWSNELKPSAIYLTWYKTAH